MRVMEAKPSGRSKKPSQAFEAFEPDPQTRSLRDERLNSGRAGATACRRVGPLDCALGLLCCAFRRRGLSTATTRHSGRKSVTDWAGLAFRPPPPIFSLPFFGCRVGPWIAFTPRG